MRKRYYNLNKERSKLKLILQSKFQGTELDIYGLKSEHEESK